jgi:fructose-bisphosphate aldolase class II
MPIATPEQYLSMLAAARDGHYAYPAINVTSTPSLNAVLRGLAEAESDGIIQISTGGAEFFSGLSVKDMPTGAHAMAEAAMVLADRYPINVALHTDHCQPDKVDTFIRPILALSAERRSAGLPPLFQSHMLDASSLPMDENLALADQLLDECAALDVVLELEIGIVGGEEDGVDNEGAPAEKLYTSPEDMLAVASKLGLGERGTYLLAAVFGNVHGVYKPGNVKLRPELLKAGQEALAAAHGPEHQFLLVFHGGSGSTVDEIHETLEYGVVKMNIDTDTQYAFTRPIVDHLFSNYDGVLKVDGEVGDKKAYDPRSYLRKAEQGMADRVTAAAVQLRSAGRTLGS